MMTFPFFNLPLNVQREVIGKLNILDAFKFSLLSKETSAIAQSTQILTYFMWSFVDDVVTLHLSSGKKRVDTEHEIVVKLEEASSQLAQGGISIGGQEVFLKEERDGRTEQLIVEYRNVDGMDLFDKMVPIWKQVKSLLKRKDQVKHEVELMDMNAELAFRVLKLSDHFNYVDIIDYENEVTAEQIEFLFDKLSCRNLWIRMRMPRDKAYTKPMMNEYLCLEHVEWIAFDALLKSQMIELHILNDSLSDSELNCILNTWLRGGLPNLQQLVMNILPARNHSKDAILAGIPWLPFSEHGKPNYSREKRYIGKIEKYHSGFDLRNDDGMCATVVIDDNTTPMSRGNNFLWTGSIELFVWHEECKLLTDEDYE